MSLGKSEADKMKGVDRQMGCSQGWFMTLVRCPKCKKKMWSNKRELYCPPCCITKEIKHGK